MNSPEHFKGSIDYSVEALRDAASNRKEQLVSVEKSAENAPENQTERLERARHDTEALFSHEAGSERRGHEPGGSVRAVKIVTDQQRAAAWQGTMAQVRAEMNRPARAFSKFIHNGGVDKVSNAVGQSLARPDAILSGSTSALILVSLVYITAKIFGYPLSGFETIGAFMIGWIVGAIYDYTRIMIKGRV